jgi:hypothetical protein
MVTTINRMISSIAGSLTAQASTAPFTPSLATQLVALVGLTGAAYTFGRWRERMYNTETNVVAEIGRYRGELARSVERLEARLGAIEDHMSSATEHRVASERRLARIEAVLENLDGRLGRVEARIEARADQFEMGRAA